MFTTITKQAIKRFDSDVHVWKVFVAVETGTLTGSKVNIALKTNDWTHV